jgi:hypothetical protein
MAKYANRTNLPADRTRPEIEAPMKKRGADQFFSGDDGKKALLAFRLNGRHIRFALAVGGRPLAPVDTLALAGAAAGDQGEA